MYQDNHENHRIPFENNANHEKLKICIRIMKIFEFHNILNKIIKNLEFYLRIMKIMKI